LHESRAAPWITGFANYVVADDDPFPNGFIVRDLWAAENQVIYCRLREFFYWFLLDFFL
jgi:hypothetical protein